MVANHALLFVPALAGIGVAVGRLCFPVFVTLIAATLAAPGTRPRAERQLARLVGWGLLAQIPYAALFAAGTSLNALFTLALGVALVLLHVALGPALVVGALGLLVALDPVLDGGLWVPTTLYGAWWCLAREPRAFVPVVIGVALAMVAMNLKFAGLAPAIAVLALLAVPLLLASPRLGRLPRLPGWTFYALYAGHLGVLWLLFRVHR